jgi:sulfur-carrier protein
VAAVIISRELARQFTAGDTCVRVDGTDLNVRELIRTLDERHPGLGPALRDGMAIAIDGLIYQDCMLEDVSKAKEVCFLPAIEGG